LSGKQQPVGSKVSAILSDFQDSTLVLKQLQTFIANTPFRLEDILNDCKIRLLSNTGLNIEVGSNLHKESNQSVGNKVVT
jgi:hypothetical protein